MGADKAIKKYTIQKTDLNERQHTCEERPDVKGVIEHKERDFQAYMHHESKRKHHRTLLFISLPSIVTLNSKFASQMRRYIVLLENLKPA